MTVILEEIRRLEAARKKGDISEAEFAKAKGRLLETVEDATVLPPFEFEPPRRQASKAAPGPWGTVMIGLLMAGLLTFVAGQLIGNITIAFTLVATVCAAIVVAAFRRLEG
ncbi:SHOCT domain-containing protein [Leisingera sp. ANG-M7]|uniref:SHOCT domain-containing protein n=1 Tax=Leisingera sp. ANG-M7 TaxID=1577902 RepID=UPI00057FF2BD|nr:SHOCT domain-containing protein [Leisingera sp. ANG-M7]KIC36125.1 hypothetical protein RA26_13340 [Leisingera sp. ANG-M7]